jgi:beta-glucosidase
MFIMNRNLLRSILPALIAGYSCLPLLCQASAPRHPLSYETADRKADSLLVLMTLDEKLDYIGGDNFFFTQKIKRLGIPAVPFVDATQGIRLNPAIINPGWKKPVKKTVAYPAPILLASTWNRDMAFTYAHSIGEECAAAGLPLLLGPGLNLYRNSQCGRNFEYFGEDPFLAGEMVASYVSGLQSTGTIATLKHFIANQTDYYRRRSNSVVDERTLQEIYMPAFRRGIDAGAKAVMTSYNLVNGEWAGQSDYVIDHLLRGELGFRWLVMTDWFSVWDGQKVIASGQDLEMPYRRATKHADRLLGEGAIGEPDIDRMVKSTLRTFVATDAFDMEKTPLNDSDYQRLEEVALNTAREGMVLLRNERNLLPVDTTRVRQILVTGKYIDLWISGRGAGYVKGYNNLTLKDALAKEFGDRVHFVKRPSADQLASADLVILNVGTEDREASDRPFGLPADQEQMVRFCSEHNPNTIVVVTSGSGIDMSKWENVPAILYTWYMGQNGATAAAEILSGRTNPSGKLPMTIERSFLQSPAYGYIPEGESLYEGFRMRKELKREVYDVRYAEGVFVGYRWYDARGTEPLFCFGHGLSYTTFEYSGLKVTPGAHSYPDLSQQTIRQDQPVDVTLNVTNTGNISGSEIIQVYVRDPKCSVPRPEKELKEFTKVHLEPGESKTVTLRLEPRDFMFWHPEKKSWVAEPGEFRILVGASSRDIRAIEILTLW